MPIQPHTEQKPDIPPPTPAESYHTAQEIPRQINAPTDAPCYFPVLHEASSLQDTSSPQSLSASSLHPPSTESSQEILQAPLGPRRTTAFPTVPRGELPNWREIKGKLTRLVGFNHAGAQVGLTIILVALFTLIKPIHQKFPTNSIYIVIASVIVAEPNQTASVRLFTQRLIGIVAAGLLSLAVLGLDALVPPKNCLDCLWKPYAVGLTLFIFIYVCVSVRESVPGQAYTSKLTDLTFVITLLGAYDDLLKNPSSPRYAPPLARMASMIVGLMLTMVGAFIFFPVRVTLVHRVVTGNLLKDVAGYLRDLVDNGYQEISLTPNMNSPWSPAMRTIAVAGGMEVLGSEAAMSAVPRKKGRSRSAAPGVTHETVAIPVDDDLDDADEESMDPARKFHEATHPKAVHIIRVLEKERARLEASYGVEIRARRSPHFVSIDALDAVIRKTRLLFYHLSGLYASTLSRLKSLNPAESTQFVQSYRDDFLALLKLMASPEARFKIDQYVKTIGNSLEDLGEVILWTTKQGTRVITVAECDARLEVVCGDIMKAKETLEVELVRLRKSLGGNGEKEGPAAFPFDRRPSRSGVGAQNRPLSVADDSESSPVQALHYSLYVRFWEATEVILSLATSIKGMVRAYG